MEGQGGKTAIILENEKSQRVFCFCQYILLLLLALLFCMHLRRRAQPRSCAEISAIVGTKASGSIEPVCALKAHSHTRFKLTSMLLRSSELGGAGEEKGCRSDKNSLFDLRQFS